MKLPAPVATLLSQANPRERRLLLAAGGVLAAAALFSLAESILDASAGLGRDLPVARARLARMQTEAAELKRLPAPPADKAAPDPAHQLDAIKAAASSRGLTLQLNAEDGGIHLTGTASFAAFTDLLAALQAEQGLRATRLVLQPQGEHVGIDALLMPVGA